MSNMEVLQGEETTDLKLKLNASQQTIATLELQLRQKEEIVIKLQAEVLRKDQAHKTEFTLLKEKLEAKEEEYNKKDTKELEEQFKKLMERETKLNTDVNEFW